jgi:hypothetical protein
VLGEALDGEDLQSRLFGLCANGAKTGAPGAQQVADRFHLALNLSAAIDRALEEQSHQLRISAQEPTAKPAVEFKDTQQS